MLQTIKNQISKLPDQPFPQYFQSYILLVQDKNMGNELKFFEQANELDAKMVIQVMNKVTEEVSSI